MSSAQERLRALLRKHEVTPRPNGGVAFTPESAQASYKHASADDVGGVLYNKEQRRAIELGVAGSSFVLTGSAGSGKTTTVKGLIQQLLANDKISTLRSSDHKWLRSGMHSIACVSFTNKAVQNMKKALPKDLHGNCITIHKLLEYQPEYFTEYDEKTGKDKTTMQFLPSRTAERPIPPIDILIVDESTMVSVDLWNTLAHAISHKCQVILIGDIHQLPPVFGKSIFIWAMQLKAEVVELVHIYRQALESPIISLALRVKEGKQIPVKDLQDFTKDAGDKGKVTIHPWKKKLGETAAIKTIQMFLPQLIDEGKYNPMEDVILTPFNKSFGTIVMNTAIASHLAKLETEEHKKEVWEIYAGIKKVYLRVGEKVLYQKSEAFITKIETNRAYYGKMPRKPSTTMDYNGIESDPVKRMNAAAGAKFGGMDSMDSIDDMLAHMGSHVDEEKSVSREASHKITLYIPDLDSEQEITGSGDINAMDLGYALTVHKSQGSEYDRVFFITHGSQANMFFRELLYTGITRAAKELYVICEANFFVKGIVTQRVPGNTLEQKIESFDRTMKLGKNGSAELPIKSQLLVSEEKIRTAMHKDKEIATT